MNRLFFFFGGFILLLHFYFPLCVLFIGCIAVLPKNVKTKSLVVLKTKENHNSITAADWFEDKTKWRVSFNNLKNRTNVYTLMQQGRVNRKERYKKERSKTERNKKETSETERNKKERSKKEVNLFYQHSKISFKRKENERERRSNSYKYKLLKAKNEKERTDKLLQNLKTVKKVDNTILGKCFEGKENELIDNLPDKFINAFKWALEYKIKNFNCKFMRIQKLANKNNEPLKSFDNYAVGFKEQLLSMLLKDKTYFISIVKKLKSENFCNFDIYSIFRFLNIDIRFFFKPDCIDNTTVFYLIFGNLKKVINYYQQNRTTSDDTNISEQLPSKLNQQDDDTNDKNRDGTTKQHLTCDGQAGNTKKRGNVRDEKEKETQIEEDKEETELTYFLKHYDEIETMFKASFQNIDEMKAFFDDTSEENIIKKKERNFDMNNEEIVHINEIKTKGLNLNMIKSIIKRSPRLALVNKETFIKRIKHYHKELNYTYDELIQLLFELPQFYAFGNLKKKYKELLYIDETIEEEDLKLLTKKYPRIFTYNIYRTIRPKLLYLIRHMNKTFKDVLSFPQYFSYSFRLRIIPRHIAFMNLYYPNYIAFYKELVKKYNYYQFNKNFNSIVYRPDIPPINLKMLLQTSDEKFRKHFKIPYDDYVTATQLAKNIHNPFIIE